MKICLLCKLNKLESEFWKQKSNKDGLHNWCKVCAYQRHTVWVRNNREKANESRRRWREKNPGKDAAATQKHYQANRKEILERYRQRRYGVSAHTVEKMKLTQGGVCAICKVVPEKQFHVDHDHRTGKVRSLLCHNCNLALGHLKDSAIIARAAADYLDTFRQTAGEQQNNQQ